MATLRSLKIKASTCRRLAKELQSYEEEAEKEAAKTAAMKEKGADPHDLKQQENVLAESRMMIPACHNRLGSWNCTFRSESNPGTVKKRRAKTSEALHDLFTQTFATISPLQAESKGSNEHGAEIGEVESTITEVEVVFTPMED